MNLLLDLLYPKKCVGCKKIGEYLCSNCIKEIRQEHLICPFCSRASIGGVTHPICRRKFGLDGLWSLGSYEGVLRISIQKIKYKWIKELGKTLVDITVEYWAKNSPYLLDQIKKSRGVGWIIVPVPLHWSRKNWRGFNQSELIGKLLAEKIGLEFKDALIRTKKTKPQVTLDLYGRKQNIKNAFSLTSNYHLAPNILLIDDVYTTGSTLKECCYILKRGGAAKVWALTLAR